MQVENDVDAVFARPLQETVEETKALGIVGVEELKVNRDTDRVEAVGFEPVDVGLGNVGFAPLMPEVRGLVGADQFSGQIFNFARRLRAAIEVKHIALGLEPVAEIDAAQQERMAGGIDEIGAGSVYETALGVEGVRTEGHKEKQERKASFGIKHSEASVNLQGARAPTGLVSTEFGDGPYNLEMGLRMNRFAPLGLVFGAFCLGLVSSSPSAAQPSKESQSTPFHLEVNVSRVLVPVVVRNAQGDLVRDLKKEDFKVFDNGKLRVVTGFTVEQRGAVDAKAKTVEQMQTPATAPPDQVILPARITVFLFDDMHMSVEDLVHARQAAVNAFPGALTGTDMAAVVSISGRVNTGLVRDRAKLQDALMRLSPQGLYRRDGMDCPNIDYYEADLIENKHDPVAVQDGNQKFANCNPAVSRPQDLGGPNQTTAENLVDSAAMRALNLGRQDVLTTYASIATFVRRMTELPGQKTLVLVSSGFLNIEREALDAESRIIDLAAQSNVTISALDARGLYTTGMTASQRSPLLGGRSFQANSEYNSSAARLAENAMAELAEGTGGVFFHNNNDLDGGLRELSTPPECVYVLELPLDGIKRNGTFHRLEMKVNRKDVQLQARRGYFMPKPEKDKK
jgi:VWFA-related protein